MKRKCNYRFENTVGLHPLHWTTKAQFVHSWKTGRVAGKQPR